MRYFHTQRSAVCQFNTLRIFESVRTNWERVGDIRFAVTLNPDSNGSAVSRENAQAVADEWKRR